MAQEQGKDLTGLEDEEDEQPGSSLQYQLDAAEAELQDVACQIEYLMQRQDKLRSKRDQLLRQIQAEQRAPKADWQRGTFPWDQQLSSTAKDVFGIKAFRPLQREVMNATQQGRDVLCLMPSGGGKSLCYQLPALVQGGLTLVVSPLLSLIQDQVCGLSALGVCAGSLTSLSSKEDSAAVYGQLDGGTLRLLYVTPEKVVSSKRFMSKLEKVAKAGRLSRIAIDEAHCCSQWGNDFRPDYKKLGALKQQFPSTPIIALTATATHQVCEDLKTILRIEGCEFFRSSVNRPNLFYEVRPKPATPQETVSAIVSWVHEHYSQGQSGIVYCLTRKDCESVAADLAAAGISATHYHADMEPSMRESVHMAWSAGAVQVMVATVAFGMGINKPDVRFVVHHSLSKSVENYYQESGRAGRDGLPARCLMYYRFSDALRQAAIVCFEPTWQPNLTAMMSYASAQAGRCRRAAIQRHFAEAPADCRCMCDNCCAAAAGGPAAAPMDATAHAASLCAILRKLAASDKKATLLQLVDAWRGSKEPDVARQAKGLTKEDAEGLVARMTYDGLLAFDFGHTAYATNTYLKATSKGLQLLEAFEAHQRSPTSAPAPKVRVMFQPQQELLQGGKAKAKASSTSASPAPAPAPATAGTSSGSSGGARSAAVEAWRQAKAQALRVFPHSILSAEQVQRLAGLELPASEAGPVLLLADILGARRAELYGTELVEVLEGRYVPPPPAPVEPQQQKQQPVGAAGPSAAQRGAGLAAGPGPSSTAARGAKAANSAKQPASHRQQQEPQKQQKQQRQGGGGGGGGAGAAAEVVVLTDSDSEPDAPRGGGAGAGGTAPGACKGQRGNIGNADNDQDDDGAMMHDYEDDDDDDFVAEQPLSKRAKR